MVQLISTGYELAFTEPVLMEVLAGARNPARERDLRRLLLRHSLLPFEAVSDFEAAAHIYGACRRVGVTPRGMIDCMIAAVAQRRGAVLLSWDADMDRLAHVVGLDMDESSLRA